MQINRTRLITTIVVVTIIGTISLLIVRAATDFVTIQPEDAAPELAVDDYIEFNSQETGYVYDGFCGLETQVDVAWNQFNPNLELIYQSPDDNFHQGSSNPLLEGPVWYQDRLFFSRMNGGIDGNLAQLVSWDEDGTIIMHTDQHGSNGNALDENGQLISAQFSQGAVVRTVIAEDGVTYETVVAEYNGNRLIGPNDLAVHPDGTIYFTDPNWKGDASAQTEERLYRATKDGQVFEVSGYPPKPNGVTVSRDGLKLYVASSALSGATGITVFDIVDGVPLNPTPFFAATESNGVIDGMTKDCDDNLYVTAAESVVVLSPAGEELARITIPGSFTTNVAFGGQNRTSLFITDQGAGFGNVYRVQMPLPGFPD